MTIKFDHAELKKNQITEYLVIKNIIIVIRRLMGGLNGVLKRDQLLNSKISSRNSWRK